MQGRTWIGLIAALLVVGLWGCGAGGRGNGNADMAGGDSTRGDIGEVGEGPEDCGTETPGVDALETDALETDSAESDVVPVSVGPDGGRVEIPVEGGQAVVFDVPAGALDHDLSLSAVVVAELVGSSIPEEVASSPEDESLAVVVELGPEGTVFSEAIAVEFPLPSPAEPGSPRRVYLMDPSDGSWSTAEMSDGSTILAVVSQTGMSALFLTDHFSTYAVGSLESIFCSPGWATGFPLAVPCSYYSQSAFAAAGTDVMLLESARKKMYVQVLKELFLRTERPRSEAELSLVDRFAQNVDQVIQNEAAPYKKVGKVFKYWELMASDALMSGQPQLFGYAADVKALGDGSKFIKEQAFDKLSTILLVADCVVEGFGRLWALHAVDYGRAAERLAETKVYLIQSKLYKEDPAFQAALAQVESDIALLGSSTTAQIVESLPVLGGTDCGLGILEELVKFAMGPLLVALKGSGVGLVAALIFEFAVLDVVMDDMIAATQKGLALAALGTLYVHGNLYPVTVELAGTDITPESWGNAALRKKLLVYQVANYANLGIHKSAAEILRMEGAGWMNVNLTQMVDWVGSLLGSTSREEIAKVHDKRRAELEANDAALVNSYPDICAGTGPKLAICGMTPPCVAVCGQAECGDDGCGGSCGTCAEGFSCINDVCVEGPCVPACAGKQCGDDGCGATCPPGCGVGFSCDNGQCIAQQTCGNGTCDVGEDHATCPQDCPCIPNCAGKECGDDGCSGSCGTCSGGETCQDGQCTGGSCWPDCGDEVLIPAGTFWMGCNEAVDDDCGSDEYPYHEVYLDGYFIDRTEVTATSYEACVSAGGCMPPSSGSYATYQVAGKEDHPVNGVTWYQAEAYCTWVGKRLPREAEWEKAARGTDGRKYPWGNSSPTCDLAVMSGCLGDTQPVCSLSPAGDSPYGLCDMAGNVWEWVADWYDSDYYNASPANNPQGPNSGSSRVERGGSFYSNYDYLRVSNRYYGTPSFDHVNLGFRCARSE